MSKLKVSAVSALVVAAAATPLVIQHQRLAVPREENRSLQEQARQAEAVYRDTPDAIAADAEAPLEHA